MQYQYQPPQRIAAPAIPTHSLLAQVLGISALGFCITALAAWLFPGISSVGGFVAMLVGFGLLIGCMAAQRSEALSLLLFYAFTFCEGLGIAPVISRYVQVDGTGVVADAAITTGLGMFALGAIVYATGLDLRRFSGYVGMALMGVIVIGIASIFVRFIHPQVYAYLILAIFSAYVLIDFARIRAGGSGASAVMLAVSIYLDALNIFLALLQIFGGRRRD
ncbi:MAG: Bax inhibitor-1/YccA family protein [Candidatus Tyrphobacter sp.]